MTIGHGTQNVNDRLQRKVLYAVASVLIPLFLCLPDAKSASWAPEDELKSYLSDNYPWEEVEVSNVQAQDTLLDERPESVQVEKGPLGRAVFSFIFRNGEKVMVSAHVRAYERVVMSKRSLQKKHVLEEEDIYLSKMDIEKLPGNSVKAPAKIIGKALKRSINANVTIKEDMIEMSQSVERGKSVVLLLSYQGMVIRTDGKTKEKGYVGMPVRVINNSSKKVVSGVLIDENTVKVEL